MGPALVRSFHRWLHKVPERGQAELRSLHSNLPFLTINTERQTVRMSLSHVQAVNVGESKDVRLPKYAEWIRLKTIHLST